MSMTTITSGPGSTCGCGGRASLQVVAVSPPRFDETGASGTTRPGVDHRGAQDLGTPKSPATVRHRAGLGGGPPGRRVFHPGAGHRDRRPGRRNGAPDSATCRDRASVGPGCRGTRALEPSALEPTPTCRPTRPGARRPRRGDASTRRVGGRAVHGRRSPVGGLAPPTRARVTWHGSQLDLPGSGHVPRPRGGASGRRAACHAMDTGHEEGERPRGRSGSRPRKHTSDTRDPTDGAGAGGSVRRSARQGALQRIFSPLLGPFGRPPGPHRPCRRTLRRPPPSSRADLDIARLHAMGNSLPDPGYYEWQPTVHQGAVHRAAEGTSATRLQGL